MPAQTVIKVRRGTAAEWDSANPTLAAGEIGLETDTFRTKFGDGSLAWADLNYSVADASGTSAVDWTSVLNKPTEFTPEAHTHTTSEITDYDKTDGTVLSDTAPTGVAGLRWIDTTNLIEYVYYDSTWVEV